MKPQLIVLAGPNGAGKSTYYDAFLADSPLPFLNADLLAAETGVGAFEAARILDVTRDRMIDDQHGFITETVFSDPYGAKLDMIRRAIGADYDVTLIYIGIAGPELSARRIDQRIARGGHDVPRDRLAARHERSLANLAAAIAFVTNILVFDNSRVDNPYRHLATFRNGARTWRARGALPAWCRAILSR